MQLYYFETPNPRKVCAVARYLEIPLNYVRVDLFQGEQRQAAFRALNPNGKVPVLIDGEHILNESVAIMAALAGRAGSDLWPQANAEQIDVLRWLMWDSAHFSRHAATLYFERHIRPKVGMGASETRVEAEADGFFRQFAAVLDAHLERRRWLVAERLSIADFAVAGCLPYAAEAALPIAEFPHVMRWHERLLELPAWREPFPPQAQPAVSATA